MPTGTAVAASPSKTANALADKLTRIGIVREEDLVLHLPLRYEDHTRLTPLGDVRIGDTVQTEGSVVSAEIQYRPRRQFVCLLRDEKRGAALVLRFFSFYPSHQKSLQPGARVRVFGDVRDGYYGPEIVHPQFKVVHEDTPLPDRLTPVYPTTAGLTQDTLRKVIERALSADPARTSESISCAGAGYGSSATPCTSCTRRRRDCPRSRRRRSMRARIPRGPGSSSTSFSRSSFRSRRIAGRVRRVAHRS
jgi:RecG-like helicase